MKKLILLALFILILDGCAYNSQTVNAFGSKVYCHGTVDKPVNVKTDVSPSGNDVSLIP